MNDAITYRGTVYPWHCDHMGHMNVMWYVGKFDEAVWNLFARVGLTPTYLKTQRRGMVAAEQHIRYLRELVAGDLVVVQSGILELRDKVVRIRQTLLDGERGHVAATMELTGIHIDTLARKALPFPPEIADAVREDMRQRPAA